MSPTREVWPGLLVVLIAATGFIIAPAACGIVEANRKAAGAVEAPASCYEAGQAVPAQRVSLDARCEALRCPPGSHAEWRPKTMGYAAPEPRCVEGP